MCDQESSCENGGRLAQCAMIKHAAMCNQWVIKRSNPKPIEIKRTPEPDNVCVSFKRPTPEIQDFKSEICFIDLSKHIVSYDKTKMDIVNLESNRVYWISYNKILDSIQIEKVLERKENVKPLFIVLTNDKGLISQYRRI